MSNFPNSLDDDLTLPRVDDNITEIGGEAINALRDAVFNIEQEIGATADGYSAKGTCNSIAARLFVSIDNDGTIKSSAIASLGLITLPIDNSQISSTAGIEESKLSLDYSTSDLFNNFNNLNTDVNTALNFISNTGSKFEPHLVGNTYRHYMDHVNVSAPGNFFKNKNGTLRDNTNLYTLFNDVNKDFVSHQKADGTTLASDPTDPDTGTIPPANYAHNASGININTSTFSFIPQTANDLQEFAQFIDNSNIFILGTRIQTLFGNGVPRTSRSTALTSSESGQNIIPYTLSTTYLLDSGSSVPVDNIDNGDDLIKLTPTSGLTDNTFDSKFALIKPGDIATVNYGSVVVSFLIKEKKFTVSGSDKTFILRINGKNLFASTTAQVKIDRPLFTTDKQGVLALAIAPLPATIPGAYPSLTVGNPRGAEVIGVGFNPDLLDSTHYNLHLQFYPTGNPADQVISLPAIDITGNQGITPGAYTLDSVVDTINTAFRKPGFNYRFIAFAYKGELGLMLADAVANASFSVVSAVVNSSGAYDEGLTAAAYSNMNNAINVFDGKDALGFGPGGANVASPPFAISYPTSAASQIPTRIIVPLKKKTYYVNGVERESLNIEPEQMVDGYGDSYWEATIVSRSIVAATRVKTTYQVNKDLTTSSLQIGKTILVQKESTGTVINFGRFVIEDIQFNDCACDGYTSYALITVYDSIHAIGTTPYVSAGVGTAVRLYFSGDSIGFSTQNAGDAAAFSNYKRHFEAYVNQDGQTFSHERARMNVSGSTQTVNGVALYSPSELSTINLYKVSAKLRGHAFASIRKINLTITSYDLTTGAFSGYLCKWDGTTETNAGPITVGKKGNVVRFYDETNIDYIDVVFDFDANIPAINSTKRIDIQLFSSLSLDDEVMLLGTCQITDSTKKISHLRDERQFGNITEKHLSTSALDYIATPTQLLHENGIIRGFDVVSIPTGTAPYANVVSVKGGVAVVNGKIVQVNNQNIAIPAIFESLYPDFDHGFDKESLKWYLCVNEKAELELIASTDFDPNGDSSGFTSDSHKRIFYAYNPNSASDPYAIRATYLSDLVRNYRDVVPIAVVKATTSLVSSTYVITSCTYSDIRRYVYNGHGGFGHPFVFAKNGNFRTADSLIAWLDELTNYRSFSTDGYNSLGSVVVVKDNMDISGKTLLFRDRIKFVGDGGALTLHSTSTFYRCRFENLQINIADPDATLTLNFETIMTGCTVNYIGDSDEADMITLGIGCKAVLTHNYFNRGFNTINAYIKVLGSLPFQIITFNFFDSDTVDDAADTALVKGLPGDSIYENNIETF